MLCTRTRISADTITTCLSVTAATAYRKIQSSFFQISHDVPEKVDKTIEAVDTKGIVVNVDKLRDYVQHENGKSMYVKKMMRITDSKILKMEPGSEKVGLDVTHVAGLGP